MRRMLRSFKAQAAMEFLMTYGWAILVVLIVIGALAYFGVLSPSTLLPEKCTFPVSLTCTDHQVLPGSITLILQNGAGRDILITRISASSEALGLGAVLPVPPPPNLGIGCSTGTIATQVRNGASATFTLNVADASTYCAYRDTGRDKNRYNISIFYNWLDSPTITHTLPGELLARKP